MVEIVERDFERSVSSGLLEALDGASRCSTPITLDHTAAADIYGTLIRNAAAIEQQDQIIAGLLEAIEPVIDELPATQGHGVTWVDAGNLRALSEAAGKALAALEGQ